jgi:hypothetical protein
MCATSPQVGERAADLGSGVMMFVYTLTPCIHKGLSG